MAKVTYFPSPLESEKSIEIVSKGTLGNALRELGIEDLPLCVTINGMTPDELSLDTVLDDTDFVEVRRLVHGGGGNSQTKSTLATVVQIAAIATASFFTGGAALAIMAAGSLAAGALNKWANDILLGQTSDNQDEQKLSTQTNDYSSKSASNKARPLAPIPVPMGSHRYAPDIQTEPLRTRYAQEDTVVPATPLTVAANAGIISSNGPMAANTSWITMPAGYLYPAVGGDPLTAIPRYPIKLAPYGIQNDPAPLDPEGQAQLLIYIKNKVDFEISVGFYPRTNFSYHDAGSSLAFPLVAYHFDPSDPYRGRFNLFWSIQRLAYLLRTSESSTWPGVTRANYWYRLNDFFNGTATTPPDPGRHLFATVTAAPANMDQVLTSIQAGLSTSIPVTMNDTNSSTYLARFSSFLTALNGGSYTTSDKTTAPDIPAYSIGESISQEYAGIPIATQIFNFGFGDIDISDKTIGSVSVENLSSLAGRSAIQKTDPLSADWWEVENITGSPVPNLPTVSFVNNVKNFQAKQLINPGIHDGLISETDEGEYNFNYFRGSPGQERFKFSISGRVYRTSPNGFLSNLTRIQVQHREVGQSVWRSFNTMPFVSIENSNTKQLYLTYLITALPGERGAMEIRIRKVNLDDSDNTGNRISELSLVDCCFYEPTFQKSDPIYGDLWKKNVPMNLDGLYTTGLISDSATTNNYTALVESRCWVFDFENEEWSWGKTRNPAFWFLYFARGGFRNESAKGDLLPPYSPTWGWVNYPGHPDSTSHIFGGGYSDEEIDIEKIKEWAFFCDERDLKIDMVVKDDTSVSEILERIANIGRASVTYNVGKLSVVIEDPDQSPVAMFGMGNIIAGSFTVDYSVGEPMRVVRGTFTNRETWEAETVEAIVPFSDENIVRDIEITMDGITEKSQAQREINILAARQFYQGRTYTWETDVEGYLAKRGDIVLLSHDSTQYGHSGRVSRFVVENGVVIGIKTGSIVDSSVEYVAVRSPDGSLSIYKCSFDGEMISFIDPYPISHAPATVNLNDDNALTVFPRTFAEDFVFIADIKETPGKRVRISEVTASANGNFRFVAVDEDRALWAYEFGDDEPGDSFDDSRVIAEVMSLQAIDLGGGRIRLVWEASGADLVQIINLQTGFPIESAGQYSFGGGEVVLELIRGTKYELEARPLTYASSEKRPKRITVWPL